MTASDDIFFFYIFCRQSSMRLNVIYHIFVYFSTYYLYFISLFVFYAQHLSFQNLLHTKKIVTGISLQHMTIKKKCLCHYTNISLFHPSFIFPESCSPRSLYNFFMKSESPVKTSCLLPSFPVLLKVCESYSYNDPTIPCRFLLSSCSCMLPAVLYVSDIVV